MYKKIIIILATLILITGCSGSEETTSQTNNMNGKLTYSHEKFTMQIPQEWEVIRRESFMSSTPKDIIIAFRSKQKNSIFTTTLNVGIKNITENTSSIDFAKSNISTVKSKLISFQEIATNNYEIPINENNSITTILVEFSGKQKIEAPIIINKQLFAVKNGLAFTITGSFLENEDESVVKQIDEMIDSFRIK